MLVLSRRQQESIKISGNIVVTVLEIQRNKVRIGIDAPKEVPVLRTELQKSILDSAPHNSRSCATDDMGTELKQEVQS